MDRLFAAGIFFSGMALGIVLRECLDAECPDAECSEGLIDTDMVEYVYNPGSYLDLAQSCSHHAGEYRGGLVLDTYDAPGIVPYKCCIPYNGYVSVCVWFDAEAGVWPDWPD